MIRFDTDPNEFQLIGYYLVLCKLCSPFILKKFAVHLFVSLIPLIQLLNDKEILFLEIPVLAKRRVLFVFEHLNKFVYLILDCCLFFFLSHFGKTQFSACCI